MTSKFKLFEKWVLLILLFLLPSQLAYHFWPEFAFVFGIRVDYFAPAVYLTDVLVIYLLLMNLRVFRKHVLLLGFILVLGIANTTFSVLWPVTLLKWVKVLEMVGFAIYISQQKVVKKVEVYKTVFFSATFFSLIGTLHFFVGSTLGREFYIFGERSFSLNTPGIALVTILGRQFLRAYSTFSHPNSLAGYLGIVIILGSAYRQKPLWFILGMFAIATAFVLSFSLTAFCAMFLVCLLFISTKSSHLLKKLSLILFGFCIVFSMLLPVFAKTALSLFGVLPENIYQRLDLAVVAGKMISQRFLFGEGLNGFIFAATKIKASVSYSWLMQPVHNIYLLVFSEVGVVGLLSASFLFYRLLLRNLASKNIPLVLCLIYFMVSGLGDHYWLTLQQNILLLALVSGMSFRPLSNKSG